MHEYPSIPGWRKSALGWPCIGFRKYDGSCLRWEWHRKNGWRKHGTRGRLFGADEDPYRQAIPIFMETLADPIVSLLSRRTRGLELVTAFTEFLGPGSFAGNHVLEDPKSLVLLDVHVHRAGILPAREFLRVFGGQPFAAEAVYEGNFNASLIEDVRQGRYDLEEGMVCKETANRRDPWTAKIKTIAYLDRLKATFGADWHRYADDQ